MNWRVSFQILERVDCKINKYTFLTLNIGILIYFLPNYN